MADSGYFGLKLGEALSSGAGHIANALQRRYELQRQDQLRQEELARQNDLRNQQMQMTFASKGVAYDPKNPAAAFEAFRQTSQQDIEGDRARQAALIKVAMAKANMGGQGQEDTGVMQTAPQELVSQYGVPGERINPYANMPVNVRAKVQPANVAFANKLIQEANETKSTAEGANAELNSVKALIEGGMETGPVIGPTKKLARFLPFTKETKEQVSAFERVANKLIPTMRQGMPGAASDRDVAMFREATINIDKPESVNKQIIDQALLVNRRIKDKADFLAQYVNAYGDAQGAQAAWDKYINSNPLFDDKGNPMPYKTYMEYFSGGSSDRQARIQELRKLLGR